MSLQSPHMENAYLVLRIKAQGGLAERAFNDLHNDDRRLVGDKPFVSRSVREESVTTAPESDEADDDDTRIYLSFDKPPKDSSRGWVFGSDRRVSDI